MKKLCILFLTFVLAVMGADKVAKEEEKSVWERPTDIIKATDGIILGMSELAFYHDFTNCYKYSMVLVKHGARSIKYSFKDSF